MSKKLNLGCGKKILREYVNLDITELPGVDIVHNLNLYPYPFKNNEFDSILCDNILEHLDSIVKPLEELYRITRPGGRIKVIVPLFPSFYSFQDPTHKSVFTYYTFDYFIGEGKLNYYSKARFKIIKKRIKFYWLFKFLELINSSEFLQKVYYKLFSSIINPEFLEVNLEVIKVLV